MTIARHQGISILRADQALQVSVTVTVLAWLGAGITTWIAIDPDVTFRFLVTLLWAHSLAIVATFITMALIMLRAFNRMTTDSQEVYALGLEHGVELADSINH
ncbi:hypothetical protein ACQPYK_25200 [Streptosporangium sp. CA-135522]|uniref:hypothetical protein n=1 Tax=Streptosporangium sp. CA-135522 TaxID=3240072 RepID=UPI003D8C2A1B